MKRTLLIDGDVVAYRHAFINEKSVDWGDGIWTTNADEFAAKASLDSEIARLLEQLEADEAVVALSDNTANFRKDKLFPDYKVNRKDVRKPLLLSCLRAYLVENYAAKLKPGLEGDDIMGIIATNPRLYPGEKIIVSIDKDMKTIPGLYYRDKEAGVVEISEAEADYFHMLQTLTGDTTDGYPGCPGIGAKKAEAILAEEPHWPRIVAAYEKAKLTEADALVQARVSRILRHSDYDYKKKEPILWTPS